MLLGQLFLHGIWYKKDKNHVQNVITQIKNYLELNKKNKASYAIY